MQKQYRGELEKIAKKRRIKNCENMSKEGLFIALLKSEKGLAKLYNKVEENKKYPDQYHPEYKEVWNIEDLFDEINEDYYEPVKTKVAFQGNYIEYESRGDTDKNL